MGIEHQLKKVKIPGLSALALSAIWLSVKPVLNLQNSRPIKTGTVYYQFSNFTNHHKLFTLILHPSLSEIS